MKRDSIELQPPHPHQDRTTAISRRRSILVVQLGGVADSVHSLPFLRVLRSEFSDQDISLLAGNDLSRVFFGQNGIEVVESRHWPCVTRLLAIPHDIIFDLGTSREHFADQVMYRWGVDQITYGTYVGFERSGRLPNGVAVPRPAHGPMWVHFLRLLSAAGVAVPQDPCYRLVTSDSDKAYAETILDLPPTSPMVSIAPGAKSTLARRWPSEHFATLIEGLHASGISRIVLLGDRSGISMGEEIISRLTHPIDNLVGITSLGSAAHVLRHSMLLIGHDRHLIALAEMLGTSVLGLFGPSENDGGILSVGKCQYLRLPLGIVPELAPTEVLETCLEMLGSSSKGGLGPASASGECCHTAIAPPPNDLAGSGPPRYIRSPSVPGLVQYRTPYPRDANTFAFTITHRCNNSCAFCAADVHGSTEERWPDMDLTTFQQIMDESHLKPGDHVHVNGGEPTLHPDFFSFLKVTREHGGYPVVFTNGVVLQDRAFIDQLSRYQPLAVLIPFYAASAALHDNLTGRNGNFLKTLEGFSHIVHLIEEGAEIELCAKLLLSKTTAPENPRIAAMLVSRFPLVFYISLNALVISRAVRERLDQFVERFANMRESTTQTLDLLVSAGFPVDLNDVPICTVDRRFSSLFPEPRSSPEKLLYSDSIGSRLTPNPRKTSDICSDKCLPCLYRQTCRGFSDEYLGLFGDEEIRPIVELPHPRGASERTHQENLF